MLKWFRIVMAGLACPSPQPCCPFDDLVRRATPWLDRLDELPFDQKRIHDLRSFMRGRLRLLRA